MACLRESTPDRRVGVVSCDEEGCLFRWVTTRRSEGIVREASEADCVLQLRLRAGDSEDLGGRNEKLLEGDRLLQERARHFIEHDPGFQGLERAATYGPEWTHECEGGVDERLTTPWCPHCGAKRTRVIEHVDLRRANLSLDKEPNAFGYGIVLTHDNGKTEHNRIREQWERSMGLPAESGGDEGEWTPRTVYKQSKLERVDIDFPPGLVESWLLERNDIRRGIEQEEPVKLVDGGGNRIGETISTDQDDEGLKVHAKFDEGWNMERVEREARNKLGFLDFDDFDTDRNFVAFRDTWGEDYERWKRERALRESGRALDDGPRIGGDMDTESEPNGGFDELAWGIITDYPDGIEEFDRAWQSAKAKHFGEDVVNGEIFRKRDGSIWIWGIDNEWHEVKNAPDWQADENEWDHQCKQTDQYPIRLRADVGCPRCGKVGPAFENDIKDPPPKWYDEWMACWEYFTRKQNLKIIAEMLDGYKAYSEVQPIDQEVVEYWKKPYTPIKTTAGVKYKSMYEQKKHWWSRRKPKE